MVLSPLTSFFFREENTQSAKEATKVKFTFIIIFSKCFTGHLKCAFDNPEKTFSPESLMLPFNDRKLSYKYFCFQKFFWKCSSAPVGYGFEILAFCFAESPSFFRLKIQNWFLKRKTNFSKGNFPDFFSLHTLIGGLTHLVKEICKKDKGITQTPKMVTEKENFFEKEIIFPLIFSLEARILVVKTLKKTFWQKTLFFSSQSPKKVAIMFNFKKKTVLHQKFLKVLRLQFWQQCR